MTDELERLALRCLLGAFAGTTLPAWMRRRVADGLAGVVLFSKNIQSRDQVASLTQSLREARSDLLIATDEEGGDVTRLEATTGSSYPGNLALGRVNDLGLTEAVAAAIGRDLAVVGINLDLAPVADVNTNPDNPIIGVRSFGDQAELVAAHVAAFVRGLKSQGIAACAKHFPGHGDTAVDSHLELPRIDQQREELATGALVPFRAAIEAGVDAIMTAHIVVPAYDTLPATLSRRVLNDLLRHELGFKGLIVTDAVEMRAISATVGINEGAVMALAAGADAICIGAAVDEHVLDGVVRATVEAVRAGRLPRQRLLDAVERINRVAHPDPTTHAHRRTDDEDRHVGLDAARRAVRVEGDVRIASPPVVVELHPEPTIAAGAVHWDVADALTAHDPQTTVVRFAGPSVDVEQVERAAAGRSLVLVVRDLHRHQWAASAVEALLARRADTVVVEMGVPSMRPGGAGGYIATHGAARVNAAAAVETLVGVQSGERDSTEPVHEVSQDLDRLDTRTLLQLMLDEDRHGVAQVSQCLDAITRAVEAIADRLRRGGTLHYFGAGTSGRLAALDAIECPDTFGISADLVVPHVAADAPDEDDMRLGVADALAANLRPEDAIVGISASGETAYVRAALDHAHTRGALTIALTCAPGSTLGRMAQTAIEVATGPEVIAGSTRLKAGTVQKVVLNMLSTGVFTRLGHVYRGRMVDVQPTNDKLRRRAAQIVRELTGVGPDVADRALMQAEGNAKLAVLMLHSGLSAEAARARLRDGHGDLSIALGESS